VAEFVCIGVSHFIGEPPGGASAVEAVRASGIAAELDAPWVDVLPVFAGGYHPIVAVNRALAETIAAHRGRVPLIFAADCTSALGACKGLAALSPAILWLDAHGDFNTPDTTPSGFIGGMPLAMLFGRGDLSLLRGLDLDPFAEENALLADARDLDPGEAEAVQDSAVTHLPDIDDLLALLLTDRPLYIHLDLDVSDPAEMPGMSHPTPGGPSLARVATVLERVARDGNVAGVLFALWDPALPGDATRSLGGLLRTVRALRDGMRA